MSNANLLQRNAHLYTKLSMFLLLFVKHLLHLFVKSIVLFCFYVHPFVHACCMVILKAEKMKEEGRRMQYMSLLVKQDQAKLDKDGESYCIAMESLKHCVENLESTSMPHFLTLVR